ncbi:MAG: sulfite exporter TauE/SafE family protein [Clostridia bacterium]
MEIIYIIFGIIGGILGGMGMGGGTLLIPLLSVFLNVPQHSAQLINLLAFIPMSVIALAVHIKNKLVVWSRLLYIIVPAGISAVVSSILAVGANTEILKKGFGIFLIVLGTVYLFFTLFQKKVKG